MGLLSVNGSSQATKTLVIEIFTFVWFLHGQGQILKYCNFVLQCNVVTMQQMWPLQVASGTTESCQTLSSWSPASSPLFRSSWWSLWWWIISIIIKRFSSSPSSSLSHEDHLHEYDHHVIGYAGDLPVVIHPRRLQKKNPHCRPGIIYSSYKKLAKNHPNPKNIFKKTTK